MRPLSPVEPPSPSPGVPRRSACIGLALSIGCGAPVGSYIPPGYHPDTVYRVFFVGDSITADYEESPIAPDLSYPSLLVAADRTTRGDVYWEGSSERNLYAHFPEIERSYNLAMPGAVAADLDAQVGDFLAQIDHIEGRVPNGAPPSDPADRLGETLVLVTIGGNDSQDLLSMAGGANMTTGHGRRLGARIGADLKRMQSQLEESFPEGVWLYAANVYEPTGRGNRGGPCMPAGAAIFTDELARGTNKALREAAEESRFAMLDSHGLFMDHGYGATDPAANPADAEAREPAHWFADCIHPNARGQHALREMFLDAVLGPLESGGR